MVRRSLLGKVKDGIIGQYVHRHYRHAAVVIGGAPCRLTDKRLYPPRAVYFSANDHGCKQEDCSYIAACENLGQRLTKHRLPVIGGYGEADIRVFDVPLPNSAALAGYAAHAMGCTPIVFAGIECYQGDTYLDDPKAESSGRKISLVSHLLRWEKLKKLCPDAPFRAVSGPLLSIFPKYSPLEEFPLPPTADYLTSLVEGQKVRFVRTHTLNTRRYMREHTYQLTQLEAQAVIREGLGVRHHAPNGVRVIR